MGDSCGKDEDRETTRSDYKSAENYSDDKRRVDGDRNLDNGLHMQKFLEVEMLNRISA